jgi:hypothetical protein
MSGGHSPHDALLRLRWRLARLLAPRPIIASPALPHETEGVWVLILKPGIWSAVRADSFRGKFTTALGTGRMRFTGTIKSSTPLYDPSTRTAIPQRSVSIE